MKTLITIISILGQLLWGQFSLETTQPQISYTLPADFEIVNTIETSGVLSVVDNHGNGLDIYVDYDVNFSSIVDSVRNSYVDLIIEEKTLDDSNVLFMINDDADIYNVDSILISQKDLFVVRMYMLMYGDPMTHGAFEGKAIQMMRSIAQGESDAR